MFTYVLFWSGSLSAGFLIRRRMATYFFLFLIFLFVGLRLDTGFDWPVYKNIFDAFREEFSFSRLALYSAVHGQEPGFLLFLGLSSRYLPSYEVFQAGVTILLLWSTVFLARHFNVRRVAFVVALMLSYLWWSVGFSTLRQSMALSFFNFGLVYALRGNRLTGWAFFTGSIFFQLSSVIYIAAFLGSRLLAHGRRPPSMTRFFVMTAIAALATPLAMQLAMMVFPLAASKLQFYLGLATNFRIGTLDVVFYSFFLAAAFLCSPMMTSQAGRTVQANQLRHFIIVLAAFGASTTYFSVVRDRISYEVFILISVYIMMSGVQLRAAFIAFFLMFAALNSAIIVFRYPTRLAFEPYQNVITHYLMDLQSTGRERNGRFMDQLPDR